VLRRPILFSPSHSLQVVVVLQQVFQLIQKVLSKWLNDAQVVEVTRLLLVLPAALPVLADLNWDSKGQTLGDALSEGHLSGMSGPVLLAVTNTIRPFLCLVPPSALLLSSYRGPAISREMGDGVCQACVPPGGELCSDLDLCHLVFLQFTRSSNARVQCPTSHSSPWPLGSLPAEWEGCCPASGGIVCCKAGHQHQSMSEPSACWSPSPLPPLPSLGTHPTSPGLPGRGLLIPADHTMLLPQSVCAIFEKSVKTLLDDFAPMVPQLCEMLGQMYSTIPQASAIDLTRQVRSHARGWGCRSPGRLGTCGASSSFSPSLSLAAGSHLCPRACPLPSHQGPLLARYLSHADPLPARYVGLTLLCAGAVVRLLHAWSLEASCQEWLFLLLAKLVGPSLFLGFIPTPGRWVPSLQGSGSRKPPCETGLP